MTASATRHLFRVIMTTSRTRNDFLSYVAQGKPFSPGASRQIADRWQGISMYETAGDAREAAMRYHLGAFVAAVALPLGGPFRMAQTGRPGYWTVWVG